MSYSLGAAQRSFDNRQATEWEPESHEMKVTDEAIDHLKAAVRAFGNGKDSDAFCSIEDAVCALMNSADIAAAVRRMVVPA